MKEKCQWVLWRVCLGLLVCLEQDSRILPNKHILESGFEGKSHRMSNWVSIYLVVKKSLKWCLSALWEAARLALLAQAVLSLRRWPYDRMQMTGLMWSHLSQISKSTFIIQCDKLTEKMSVHLYTYMNFCVRSPSVHLFISLSIAEGLFLPLQPRCVPSPSDRSPSALVSLLINFGCSP